MLSWSEYDSNLGVLRLSFMFISRPIFDAALDGEYNSSLRRCEPGRKDAKVSLVKVAGAYRRDTVQLRQ